MLFDPARHEALDAPAWSEAAAREAIEWIVDDAIASYVPGRYWPVHPRDAEPGDDTRVPSTSLYFGAAGMAWALRYLHDVGATPRRFALDLDRLRDDNRAWLRANGSGSTEDGSYLMGELPIALMAWADAPDAAREARLAELIEATYDHPSRELMWGSPGALLAASFLHEASGDARWRAHFRRIAAHLEGALEWSADHGCYHWTQDLYGHHCRYLDAVHGFVATASVLIRGRHLLEPEAWARWQARIVRLVAVSATHEEGRVNWRPELSAPAQRPIRWLMQYCHGAPGFVVCLAQLPTRELDDLLLAAGETVWHAGPLAKGSNLCHGTAGNGHAFLVLHERSGDSRWLARARAFAMHAIGQARAEAERVGYLRHSLWTGDVGLAIYLWDCLRGRAAFPTLDVFFGAPPRRP